MMIDDIKITIAEKIAKIVAKAESTTSAAEAETFMAKAQAMMLEHGIDLLMLGQLDKKDPVGTDKFFTKLDRLNEPWAKELSSVLAWYFGCRVVWHKTKLHWLVSISGREGARITYMLMLPFVIRQVRKLGKELAAEEGLGLNAARRQVGNALYRRIQRMLPEVEAKVQATGHGTALVPVDAIEVELRDVWGELKYSKTGKLETTWQAVEKAKQVSLNTPVGKAGGKAAQIGRN